MARNADRRNAAIADTGSGSCASPICDAMPIRTEQKLLQGIFDFVPVSAQSLLVAEPSHKRHKAGMTWLRRTLLLPSDGHAQVVVQVDRIRHQAPPLPRAMLFTPSIPSCANQGLSGLACQAGSVRRTRLVLPALATRAITARLVIAELRGGGKPLWPCAFTGCGGGNGKGQNSL